MKSSAYAVHKVPIVWQQGRKGYFWSCHVKNPDGMSKQTRRTHIVVPEEMIAEVDRVAGERKRCRFVEAAVREKLARSALAGALAETAGILSPKPPEQVRVHKLLRNLCTRTLARCLAITRS